MVGWAALSGLESNLSAAARYELLDEIGAGGMASVHLARVRGSAGFSRVVAIKKIHPHLAAEDAFVRMFLDEGRLSGRIHHPNAVATLDVVAEGGVVLLVMEYVHGETLARLAVAGERMPVSIVSSVVSDALRGLHAAHEAKGDRGEPLQIVHRDVSPQNIMVGDDGVARVLDFGIARATLRASSTQPGELRGKVPYMAPEQLRGDDLDRRVDIYAMGVVLWEALTGRRLYEGRDMAQLVSRVLEGGPQRPSAIAPDLAPLDDVVMRALAAEPSSRFATALDMADALEAAAAPARPREVSEWVRLRARAVLEARAARIAELVALPASPPTPRRAPAELATAPLPDTLDLKDASPSAAPAPWATARKWAAALGTLVLLAFGSAFAIDRARRDVPSASASASAATASAAGPQAASSPPAFAPLVDASDVTVRSSSALASVDAGASTDAAVTAGGRARPPTLPAKGAPAARPRRAPRVSCDPPYVLEPDGTKRFRSECL